MLRVRYSRTIANKNINQLKSITFTHLRVIFERIIYIKTIWNFLFPHLSFCKNSTFGQMHLIFQLLNVICLATDANSCLLNTDEHLVKV